MKNSVRHLLDWFDRRGRRLPWRETRDPYAILVSEIMLQQTQVSRVVPYFRTWLERFPDWAALAAAPTAEVLRLWSGLGYNRRALMLQEAARTVARDGVPTTEDGWRTLKGLGAYTAAAVTLFSTGRRTVPIDTNLRRVGGRLGLGKPFPAPADDPAIRLFLEPWLRATRRPADLVQALFDLASLVCAKTPRCPDCPVRAACRAEPLFRAGRVTIPRRSVRRATERHHADKPHPDRIYRGRILRLVTTEGSVPVAGLGARIDPGFRPDRDAAWLDAMLARLIADGLLRRTRGRLHLPATPPPRPPGSRLGAPRKKKKKTPLKHLD